MVHWSRRKATHWNGSVLGAIKCVSRWIGEEVGEKRRASSAVATAARR